MSIQIGKFLPKKKKEYKPTPEQVGGGAYYDLREIEGYNQCRYEASKVEIGLDEYRIVKALDKAYKEWDGTGLWHVFVAKNLIAAESDLIVRKDGR